MEHIYKEMMKGVLRKKYHEIKKKRKPNLIEQGRMEMILELYEYFGFENIDDKTLTPDQQMVRLFKNR